MLVMLLEVIVFNKNGPVSGLSHQSNRICVLASDQFPINAKVVKYNDKNNEFYVDALILKITILIIYK